MSSLRRASQKRLSPLRNTAQGIVAVIASSPAGWKLHLCASPLTSHCLKSQAVSLDPLLNLNRAPMRLTHLSLICVFVLNMLNPSSEASTCVASIGKVGIAANHGYGIALSTTLPAAR